MTRRHMIVAGAVLALAGGGAGVAWAVGGEDDGEAVTGPAADRAKAAAVASIPGGKANEVERGDDGGAAWEVEVTRPDGKTVDVLLDTDHRVIGTEQEDGPEDDDGGKDDDD